MGADRARGKLKPLLILLAAGLTAWSVQEASGQVVIEQHIGPREQPRHEYEVHGTDRLYSDPEIHEAYERYVEWNARGRPGYDERQVLGKTRIEVGTMRTFRVRNLRDNSWEEIEFRLEASGDESLIWVDPDEWGPDKVTSATVEAILEALEVRTPFNSIDPNRGILSIEQEYIGSPPDVDGSGILNVLLVDIQDDWDEEEGGGFVAGYVNPADLDPERSGNGMDIIYIDTYPGIYGPQRAEDPTRPLNTVAHEYQHLINAGNRVSLSRGQMPTFQDEGQSEWAEILTGYSGRQITYLNTSSETNRHLYTWRSGDDVLNDYQRAGLFHTYIAERIGETATGSLTLESGNMGTAYQNVLDDFGLQLEDVLTDFHVANWLNNPALDDRYGYAVSQRRSVRATIPTVQYGAGESGGGGSRELSYGGAEYIRFAGVSDMSLTVTSGDGIYFHIVERSADTGAPNVRPLTEGTHTIDGDYESVVLIAVNARPGHRNLANPPSTGYSYEAEWTPLPIIEQIMAYAGQAAFYTELLSGDADDSEVIPVAYAVRFSPEISGRLQQFDFAINGRPEMSLSGSGMLRLTLMESIQAEGEGPNALWIPDVRIDSVDIDMSQLQFGINSADLTGSNWAVEADSEYHVLMRLVEESSDARIEVLLDGGSTNESDERYYPVRTLGVQYEPASGQSFWTYFQGHNNILAGAAVVGSYVGPLEEPAISIQPVLDRAVLFTGDTLHLSVEASGQPSPSYQWYRNGDQLPGRRNATLEITDLDLDDAGTYSVRVSNFAGSIDSDPVEVIIERAPFGIVSVHPSPSGPMHDLLTVTYNVDLQQRVRIVIYDSAGRQVRELSDNITSSGRQTLRFGRRHLGSGVYYVRIIGSESVDTRSFVIQ